MIPEPNANSSLIVWEIAVPAPLHTTFEYLPPENEQRPEAGSRVLVPFAGRESIGFSFKPGHQHFIPQKN